MICQGRWLPTMPTASWASHRRDSWPTRCHLAKTIAGNHRSTLYYVLHTHPVSTDYTTMQIITVLSAQIYTTKYARAAPLLYVNVPKAQDMHSDHCRPCEPHACKRPFDACIQIKAAQFPLLKGQVISANSLNPHQRNYLSLCSFGAGGNDWTFSKSLDSANLPCVKQ